MATLLALNPYAKIAKMDGNVWIGIGLNIRSTDVGYDEFVELNRYLVKEYNCSYIFNTVKLQPHINLYDMDIPVKNLEKVKEDLGKISRNSGKIKVSLDKVTFFEYGAIFINCFSDSQLIDLEKNVVTKISKYREGVITKDYWQPWIKYDEQQIENRERYGSPHVLNSYKPHITIGFVKESPNALEVITNKLNESLKIKELEFNGMDLVVHDNNSELIDSEFFKFQN